MTPKLSPSSSKVLRPDSASPSRTVIRLRKNSFKINNQFAKPENVTSWIKDMNTTQNRNFNMNSTMRIESP